MTAPEKVVPLSQNDRDTLEQMTTAASTAFRALVPRTHDGRAIDGTSQETTVLAGLPATIVTVDGDDPSHADLDARMDLSELPRRPWPPRKYGRRAGWGDAMVDTSEITEAQHVVASWKTASRLLPAPTDLLEAADAAFADLDHLLSTWQSRTHDSLGWPQLVDDSDPTDDPATDDRLIAFNANELLEAQRLIHMIQAECYRAMDRSQHGKISEPSISIGWGPHGLTLTVWTYNLYLDRNGRQKTYGPFNSAAELVSDLERLVAYALAEVAQDAEPPDM